ncbi:MAG: type II secretion system F family protein [Kamptonema sp. SIO4C4]|nr:type II secretion system F family protein [Kamptonema sp. SIO4C4]
MPTFVAEVQDGQGNTRKIKEDATSAEQMRTMLQGRYASVGAIKKAGLNFDLTELEEKMASVTVKDKAIMSRQFAVMINAGIAIVRCLGILTDQCANPKLKKALTGLSSDVQQGVSLSESMRKYPECFDQLYVSMVDAGEVGGVLDQVLDRLALLLENMQRLKNQVKSAMSYPVAVGGIAVIVFFAMTIFLIPIFANIFQELGTELPALTQFMLLLSSWFTNWMFWAITIPAIFGLITLYRWYYSTPAGRLQMDHLFLKMPLFGDLNEKTAVARFCRIFGTLTRSGVPILNCLDIVRDIAGNQVIANSIEAAKQEIQQGGMISVALEREGVFPPLAII